MPAKAAPPMANPELLVRHNIETLAAKGLSPERIAIDLRLKVSQVEAVLGGEAVALRAAIMHQPTADTLAKVKEARRIVADYTARCEYLSGRKLSQLLGVSVNWLSQNTAQGRKNPHYAWALELQKQLEVLAKYRDPKMCNPNNRGVL